MSEAPPTRGRSSTRGGRAGLSRGGPRGTRKPNGTSNDASSLEESLEDQGEIGVLKKKYSSQIAMLKDMFKEWTDTDLAVALEEHDGDISAVAEKISLGDVQQFAEVKKPKDRARSKVKEESTTAGATDKPGFGTRGTRGRGGFEGARGGRARGSDRGRGGHRGGRGGHATTNGISKEGEATSVPTNESTAWDTTASADPATAGGGWDDTAPAASKEPNGSAASAPSLDVAKSSVIADGGAKKQWASLFSKPAPAPAPAPVPQKQILTKPPPAAEVPAQHVEPATELPSEPVATEETKEPDQASDMPLPMPAVNEPASEPAIEDTPVQRPLTSAGEDLTLTPSKDPLTEENVEHLPDESIPPATQTVASTTGSLDPRNLTPLPTQQAPIGRPPISGYAAAANRLASTGGRSASFQRRVLEQQEAVVMPGHNAIDRAALQFGSMGLNGEPDPDVDEEREEPETRQAPQNSPPSQPRTSLPPAPQAVAPQQPALQDSQPTPKQAPGLPPASAQNQQQIQDGSLGQSHQEPQAHQQYNNQYGRYGAPGMQQDSATQQQKPYDPFGHQAQQSQFDQYSHAQQQQHQQAHPSGFGGLSSAPEQYSQYYTSDQQRNVYNQYYGNSYSQQEARPQASQSQSHDPTIGPPRSTSGFGTAPNESAFASQGQQQGQTSVQNQSRFAEAPGSGNNTPNPLLAAQQQQQQSLPTSQAQQHSMHAAQGHHQGAYNASFPYGHPNYSSPYQAAYANQFTSYNQFGGYGGAGGGYQGKQGGMHGAPYGYGMGSQSSYDHYSSSPANAGAFSQNQQGSIRSASGMGSAIGGGLEDYGRGSAQSGSHQQSSTYGAMNDPFGRSASGYGAQGSYGQQNHGAGQEDSLKSFDNSKSGPSPALGQPGRPGSAVNSGVNNAQSGLPPPPGQHSAFGGNYPGFAGQGNQYGGLGGLGGHGQGQGQGGMGNQYGNYGQNLYGQYGGGRGSGWAQSYGAH